MIIIKALITRAVIARALFFPILFVSITGPACSESSSIFLKKPGIDNITLRESILAGLFQKLFDRIPRFPVTLFPESKKEILKRLSLSVKNRYYTRTMIASLKASPMNNSDPWHFLRLRIVFSSFLVRGLPFDNAELILDNVKINPSFIRYSSNPASAFRSIGKISFFIKARADKLGEYFVNEAKKFKVSLPLLSIKDSKMSVSGKLKTLWCDMNIFSVFHPETDNRHQIHFIIDSMKMGGIGVPRFITEKMLKTFNPVIKIESELIPFFLYPVRTRVSDDSIIIYAKGDTDFKYFNP